MSFIEDDVKKLKEFGSFLNERAKFTDLSISDSVKLISLLQFYNKLAEKVEANIFEVKNISQPAKKK